MASAFESNFKTTSTCTAACTAQAFLGLAAEIGSRLAPERIYVRQIDNVNMLACWIVKYGGQQEGRHP